MQQGVKKEDIKKSLVEKSWQVSDIEEAFRLAMTPNQNQKLPSVGALLKESFKLYKKHFWIFLRIYAFLMPPLIFRFLSDNKIFVAVIEFIFYFIAIIVQIALIYAIHNLSAGQTIRISNSFRNSFSLIFSFIWMVIIISLIMVGTTIPLFVPAIIISILFIFSLYVLMVENQRGLNALLRSRHLVKGNLWGVLGRFFQYFLIIVVPIFVLFVLFKVLILTQLSDRVLAAEISNISSLIYVVIMFLINIFFVIYSYQVFRFLRQHKPLEIFNPQEKRGLYKGLAIWGIIVLIGLFAGIHYLGGKLEKNRQLSPQEENIIAEDIKTGKITDCLGLGSIGMSTGIPGSVMFPTKGTICYYKMAEIKKDPQYCDRIPLEISGKYARKNCIEAAGNIPLNSVNQINNSNFQFSLALGVSKIIGDTTISMKECPNNKFIRLSGSKIDAAGKVNNFETTMSAGDNNMDAVGQPYGVLIFKSSDVGKCIAEFEYRLPSTVELPLGQDVIIKPGMQWRYDKDFYIIVAYIDDYYKDFPIGLFIETYTGGGEGIVFNRPVRIGDKVLLFKVINQDIQNKTATISVQELK